MIDEPITELAQTRPIAAIKQAVSEHFNIRAIDMIAKRRTGRTIRPRHIAMWLAREYTTASLPAIGRHFGVRDHTTVVYAIRKIDELREIDAYLAEHDQFIGDALDAITRRLGLDDGKHDPAQLALPLVA
jgi:chromosomal replication initiator protein